MESKKEIIEIHQKPEDNLTAIYIWNLSEKTKKKIAELLLSDIDAIQTIPDMATLDAPKNDVPEMPKEETAEEEEVDEDTTVNTEAPKIVMPVVSVAGLYDDYVKDEKTEKEEMRSDDYEGIRNTYPYISEFLKIINSKRTAMTENALKKWIKNHFNDVMENDDALRCILYYGKTRSAFKRYAITYLQARGFILPKDENGAIDNETYENLFKKTLLAASVNETMMQDMRTIFEKGIERYR